MQANVFARRHQDRRIVFENQSVRKYAQTIDLKCPMGTPAAEEKAAVQGAEQ